VGAPFEDALPFKPMPALVPFKLLFEKL